MSKHISCSDTTHKISASLPQADPKSNELKHFHNSPFCLQRHKVRSLQTKFTWTLFAHHSSLSELSKKCFCFFLPAKPPLVSSHKAFCERLSLLVEGAPALDISCYCFRTVFLCIVSDPIESWPIKMQLFENRWGLK